MTTDAQDKCYLDGLHGLIMLLKQRADIDPHLSEQSLCDLEECADQLLALLPRFRAGRANVSSVLYDRWLFNGLRVIIRMLEERLLQT